MHWLSSETGLFYKSCCKMLLVYTCKSSDTRDVPLKRYRPDESSVMTLKLRLPSYCLLLELLKIWFCIFFPETCLFAYFSCFLHVLHILGFYAYFGFLLVNDRIQYLPNRTEAEGFGPMTPNIRHRIFGTPNLMHAKSFCLVFGVGATISIFIPFSPPILPCILAVRRFCVCLFHGAQFLGSYFIPQVAFGCHIRC